MCWWCLVDSSGELLSHGHLSIQAPEPPNAQHAGANALVHAVAASMLTRPAGICCCMSVHRGGCRYPSDDINKFLWMVRIGGGVFPEIKERDYLGQGNYRVDAQGGKVGYVSRSVS